ncbi:hypothetical protein HYT52_02960 [Candidatus Woesearchaeota archaeon]|nr:hypothetical protein [Candidatus Woesearchaeota archaeon]
MKDYFNTLTGALVIVYHSKKYLSATLIIALAIFFFNVLVVNIKLLFSTFSFSLLLSLLYGAAVSMAFSSIFILAILSILAGIVAAMSMFLIQRQIAQQGEFSGALGMSSSSALISLIAPSCSSCGIGLLSVLGLGGFFALLPFKGLEIGVLGIVLLVISIVQLSKKISINMCSSFQERKD